LREFTRSPFVEAIRENERNSRPTPLPLCQSICVYSCPFEIHSGPTSTEFLQSPLYVLAHGRIQFRPLRQLPEHRHRFPVSQFHHQIDQLDLH
jgi:hypothetical protein